MHISSDYTKNMLKVFNVFFADFILRHYVRKFSKVVQRYPNIQIVQVRFPNEDRQ